MFSTSRLVSTNNEGRKKRYLNPLFKNEDLMLIMSLEVLNGIWKYKTFKNNGNEN